MIIVLSTCLFPLPLNFVFDTTDLSALEDIMGNLEDLASTNPKQAVELITGLQRFLFY